MNKPLLLALSLAIAAAGCQAAPPAQDSPPQEPQEPPAPLVPQGPQKPVITADTEDGCFEVAAPVGADCEESVRFCKRSSGFYVSGGMGTSVAWVYPADPGEEFEGGEVLRCDVLSVDPCRQQALILCDETGPGRRIRQVTLPRGELLRATWEEGTPDRSAIFTVEFQSSE